jgi:hypothetical protein
VWLVRAGRQQGRGRQTAEQCQKGPGPELVGGASQAGRPQRPGQGGNVFVGGDHFGWGQVAARECRRARVLIPALHTSFLPRPLLPSPSGARVGGKHGPAGSRPQLRSGLPRRANQDVAFDRGSVVIVEPGRLVGDDGNAGQVDRSGSQRLGGQRQPPQRRCQVQKPASAPAGHR